LFIFSKLTAQSIAWQPHFDDKPLRANEAQAIKSVLPEAAIVALKS